MVVRKGVRLLIMKWKQALSILLGTALLGGFYGGVQGKSIDLLNGGYQFSPMPYSITQQDKTLIFSDSPEYVEPTGGILSGGTVNGASRVYFYHVNNMADTQKMAIVLENKSVQPNVITVHRELQTHPSDDYFAVGRELSRLDLDNPLPGSVLNLETSHKKDKKKKKSKQTPLVQEQSFTIAPFSRAQIFKELDNTGIDQDQLFSGIVDFTTSQDAFVSVLMMPKNEDPLVYIQNAQILPMDSVELRGTYTGALRTITVPDLYNSDKGNAYVEVVNDREDPFLLGRDEISNGKTVKDKGNYGVSYKMLINTTGKEAFHLFFNPLGGAYSGSFLVSTSRETKRYDVGSPYIGHGTIYDSVDLGEYNGGESLAINFMPAGASNLPIRFLLIQSKDIAKEGARKKAAEEARQAAMRAQLNAHKVDAVAAQAKLAEQKAYWDQEAAKQVNGSNTPAAGDPLIVTAMPTGYAPIELVPDPPAPEEAPQGQENNGLAQEN